VAKRGHDSMVRHREALARKPEADLNKAADTFVELFAKTGDLGYAKDCWRMALNLPRSAGELLPEGVFRRGLGELASKQAERNRAAQSILDKATLDAAELIRMAISKAKNGKIDGTMWNKSLEAAFKILERQLGAGKGAAEKRPMTAVQTNVNIVQAANVQGMSERQLGQYAAKILSECSPPGPGSVDGVQPADQGQAGRPGSAEAEQGPG